MHIQCSIIKFKGANDIRVIEIHRMQTDAFALHFSSRERRRYRVRDREEGGKRVSSGSYGRSMAIEGVSGYAFAFQLQSFSLEFSYKAQVRSLSIRIHSD